MTVWADIHEHVPKRWYAAETLPDEVDDRIDAEIDAAVAAEDPTSYDVADDESTPASMLLVYAERATARAVRNDDPQLLRRAAAALVLGGPAADYREVFMRIAVIDDGAARVRASLRDVIDWLARFWPEPRLTRFEQFDERQPSQRKLSVMHYRAEGSGDSFRYVNTDREEFDPAAFAAMLEQSGAPQSVIDQVGRSGQ